MIVNLLRFVSIDYESTLPWTLNVLTDVPGPGMVQVVSLTIPGASSRAQYRAQLPQDTRAVKIGREYIPNASADLALYSVRFYRRPIGGAAGWSWWTDPTIPPTTDDWQRIPIAIPGTSEQWTRYQIPIPGTSEQWTRSELPIDQRGMEWGWIELPGGEQ